MGEREQLTRSARWVVKVGSSLLATTDTGSKGAGGLNTRAIGALAGQMAKLKAQGVEILLVSSGAIVAGMQRMGWAERPEKIAQLQAAAAIGQMGLAQCYESAFKEFGLVTAQVLLTHADLANRERYLNARNVLRALLALGVIPIINENDVVVNDEIRFGDNDTLAALVANLAEAEVLALLTDREGLYDRDPRGDAGAELIARGRADDAAVLRAAGVRAEGEGGGDDGAGVFGRGGMRTKVIAARQAAGGGAATVIADGRVADILLRMRAGEEVGTLLTAKSGRLAARKQWLVGQLRGTGKLVLDDGAVRVLRESGKSLLPIGVTEIKGAFKRGDIITCVDGEGREVAHGLVNYSSEEAGRIIGKSSREIAGVLGYHGESELIHRDNMALLR